MKNPVKSRLEAKKYRLKRRSKHILDELLRTAFLLVAISIVGAAIIYGYNFAISSPFFQIKEIIVHGCKELTEKEILSSAAIKPSQNLLAINLGTITRRIESNPWVKRVSVGREFPNRLVIDIQERTAIASVKRGNGFSLMDSDGVIFKKLEKNDEVDIPVLNGCYSDDKDSVIFTKSLELLRYLSASNEFPTIRNVAEIHGHDVFGLSLFTDSGLCLRLGFDSYENKLKRLNTVMADLERRNMKLGFLLIDLNDPAKITVQKKDMLSRTIPIGSKKGYRT
ncbi:MAG TPA: FtsQ-type POTRA domain-containing protein [Syntrophales bacterium]|nr:FtsQ-type POTRA domain-containing protein [Syntrophales bacterium]